MAVLRSIVLALGIFLVPALAQAQTPIATTPFGLTALGFQQFTPTTSQALPSIPVGATSFLMECDAQAVRWRDDGTAPTASIGFPLLVGTTMTYKSLPLSRFLVIQQASAAVCNVSYYK